jgi:hypothetical protein
MVGIGVRSNLNGILEAVAPQIEFSFQLTEEDVALASDAFSVRWRRCLLPGLAISAVGALGAIALIVLQPDWLEIEFPQWLGMDFAVIAGSLVIAGSGKLIPKLRRSLAIRQFRRTPTAQNAMTYQVFDDRVTVTSELGNAQVRWEGFLKAEERLGHLILYTSPITGYIIPLAYLTASQASQLRELVRERITGPPPASQSLWRRRF